MEVTKETIKKIQDMVRQEKSWRQIGKELSLSHFYFAKIVFDTANIYENQIIKLKRHLILAYILSFLILFTFLISLMV